MTAWKQLRTGRVIDLTRPDLTGLDISLEIAVPLARTARWSGHTNDVDGRLTGYSVAQHCVIGAEALLAETGCATTALAFLVHDAHEALIGDITAPVVLALDDIVDDALRIALAAEAVAKVRSALGCGLAKAAMDGLKARLGAEIHALAGLPPARMVPKTIRDAVAEMDLRMLDIERRQLLAATRGKAVEDVWPASILRAAPVRIRGRLTPWRPEKAAFEWLRLFEQWRIRPSDGTTSIDSRRRQGERTAA